MHETSPDSSPSIEQRDLTDTKPSPTSNQTLENESTLLLVGGTGIFLAAYLIDTSMPPQAPRTLWHLVAIGCAFLIAGFSWAHPSRLQSWFHRSLDRSCRRMGIDRVQAIYLLIALASAIIASTAAGDDARMHHAPLATGAWVLGIALTILGCWRSGERLHRPSWPTILLFIFFFSVAFLLRGFDTQSIPSVLTGDEGSVGLSALEFSSGRFNNIFAVGWFDFPSLFFYLQSLSIRIFGQTIPALRLPSALIGAVTVGGVYLAGRAIFDRTTGVLAAIFLAGFHFHIHFSRLGLNNIWDPMFFLITLSALWYGWREDRRIAFILAGAAAGLAQYFYASARLLLLLVPLWMLIISLTEPSRFKRCKSHYLPMFLSAVAVVLPLMLYFAARPMQYLAPLERVNILGDWVSEHAQISGYPEGGIVWAHLLTSLKAFTSTPTVMFYTPEVPILRSLAAGIFIFALALLLWHWRDARSWFILLWLLLIAVTGGLSTPVPAAQRYVAAAPALALLVALPFSRITALFKRFSPLVHRLAVGLAILAVSFLAYDDLRFYYYEFTPNGEFSDLNTWVAQSLADELQTKDASWQVVFFGMPRMAYHSIASLPYLAPHIRAYTPLFPWGAPENPDIPQNSKLIFVFLQEHQADLKKIALDYPGGQLREVYTDDHVFLYWMYTYNGT